MSPWPYFWVGIVFIVGGFVLVLVGVEALGVSPTDFEELILTALTEVYASLQKAVAQDVELGERLRVFGSALVNIGFVLLAVSIVLVLRRRSRRSEG